MANALSTLRQSFSPLQYVNFRIYLGGQAISLIGTWLQNAAQAWVVWTLTGSEAALGTVTVSTCATGGTLACTAAVTAV